MKAPRTKPTPTAPTVANLSHEEKISWLVHQHEGIQDWRLTVDEQLAENKGATQKLGRELGEVKDAAMRLEGEVKDLKHGQTETHLMLSKVLMAVQGQTDKGLERPGLTDDMKRLEAELKAHKDKCEADRITDLARTEALETWKNRGLWTAIGFSFALTGSLFYYSDKLLLIAHALAK